MKKKSKIYILMFIILSLGLFTPSRHAYTGEGDCTEEHNITEIDVPYVKEVSINLDGQGNEAFWEENDEGKKIIATANEAQKVIYVDCVFLIDDNYLYILAEWQDSTTLPPFDGVSSDGIYFCMNIDVPEFSAYFPDGMNTISMGGGTVDSWSWYIDDSNDEMEDTSFDESGWDTGFDFNDIDYAYSYIEDTSYSIEIQRPLTTNDESVDVQYDKEELYLFNLGIMNDSRHQDHYISWTHGLDFRPEEEETIDDGENGQIPGYSVVFLISLSILISILILKNIKNLPYKKRKIE